MAEASLTNAGRRTRQRLLTIDADAGERHASWLELFFDLVFVLAVSKLSMVLAQSPDLSGFVKYAALFVPLWWAWVGFTFHADRFESDETIYRVMMFAGMLAVAALSLTLDRAFTPAGDLAFIGSYCLVLLVLVSLYGRTAYAVPLARVLAVQYIVGLGSCIAILLLSLLMPPPERYYIWAFALVLELGTPFLRWKATRSLPIDFSHIPERLGLFTIIVLGEAVFVTATGAANVAWHLDTITAATLGFAMAACIWWMNFEFVEDSAVRSRTLGRRFIYLFGHFFIVSSIVAVGVGIEHAIKETGDAHLHLPTLLLIGGGTAACLGAITVVRFVSGVCRLIIFRIAAIAIALLLIPAGFILPPLVLLALFFAVYAGGVWLEGKYAEVKPKDETPRLEACEHSPLATVFKPRSHNGCEECIKNNYKWVHLRLCLECGHVGCCDSSVHKHATKHFHKQGHPIMASLEEGENWSWCYEDERFVPLAHHVGKLNL